MRPGRFIDTANPVESRHGKHHHCARTGFDTVGHFEIGFFGRMAGPLSVDDKFPAPIRLPFLMEIADDRDPPERCSPAAHDMPLIRIVVRQ